MCYPENRLDSCVRLSFRYCLPTKISQSDKSDSPNNYMVIIMKIIITVTVTACN